MKIILSFDVEGDFHKYIHSPYIWHTARRITGGVDYSYSNSRLKALKNYLKWKLANIVKKRASGARGIKSIIYFLKKTGIPASLNLCGYLYADKPEKISLKMPWAIGKLKKDSYYWQKLGEANLHFSKILIDSKFIGNKNIDFGIHGFIHEAFPLEDEAAMALILKKSIEAGKKLGITIKTFVPPFNMLFNKNAGKVLRIMKKSGISCVRCAGEDNYFKNFKHEMNIKPAEKRGGIKIIYLSDSLEGTDPPKRVMEIIRNIKKNYSKNAVYCIMCHDYSFRNPDNLFMLVEELRKIKKDYPVAFANLREA